MKLAVAITSGVLMLAGPSIAWASCDAKQSSHLIPTSRYEINGGEVYDTKTNLTWQRCSYGQHWKDGACVGFIEMETAHQMLQWNHPEPGTGWRMPTTDELKTLISPPCEAPSINEEAFPNMDLRKLRYWTNNSNGNEARDPVSWYVNFRLGRSYFSNHPDLAAVRLVRDGR